MKTAEQRARDLYERLFRTGAHLRTPVPINPLALITTAIREAENAKLEEAALFFETGGDEAWMVYPKEIARNVRSLKFGADILLEQSAASH